MTRIAIHPSVEIAWSIANIEACHSGSERIEPIHFLLGALKIMDENFYSEAESMDVSPQVIESVVRMASQCRSAVKMSSEGVKVARRGIRRMLRRRGEAGTVQTLHRSGASRYLFQKAGRHAHKLRNRRYRERYKDGLNQGAKLTPKEEAIFKRKNKPVIK